MVSASDFVTWSLVPQPRCHVSTFGNGVDLTGLLGGHKRRLGVWGTEFPQRGPGRSPGSGLGTKSPRS